MDSEEFVALQEFLISIERDLMDLVGEVLKLQEQVTYLEITMAASRPPTRSVRISPSRHRGGLRWDQYE